MRYSSITVNLTPVAENDMRGILNYLLYCSRVDISLYARRVRAAVKAIYRDTPDQVYTDVWRSQMRSNIIADILRSWKDYCQRRGIEISSWPVQTIHTDAFGAIAERYLDSLAGSTGNLESPIRPLMLLYDVNQLDLPLVNYEVYDAALRTIRRDLKIFRKCCGIAKSYPFGTLFVQRTGG